MHAQPSKPLRRKTATLKLLASSLILSMTLTGCGLRETRLQFLTPKFQPDELVCKDAPRGQLPLTATNEQVSGRIIDNDDAGEDCRQKLAHAKMKVETFNEVVADINAGKNAAKSKKEKK